MAEPASSIPAASPHTLQDIPTTQETKEPIAWPENIVEEESASAIASRVEEIVESGRESIEKSWALLLRSGHRLARRAAERARFVRRERPLQVVAGVAAIAFTAGVILRIWRSRYE